MIKSNEREFKISFRPEWTKVSRHGNTIVAEVVGYLKSPTFSETYKYFDYKSQKVKTGHRNVHLTGMLDGWDGLEVRGKGIAILNEDDTFNFERGQRIALAKAETNAYKKAAKSIRNTMEKCQFYMESALEFQNKVLDVAQHNIEYINRVDNGELDTTEVLGGAEE